MRGTRTSSVRRATVCATEPTLRPPSSVHAGLLGANIPREGNQIRTE